MKQWRVRSNKEEFFYKIRDKRDSRVGVFSALKSSRFRWKIDAIGVRKLDTHTRPKYLVIRLDEYETRKSDLNPR